MPRGGYRKGAGRKPEYNEPIIKFLVGLPKSVMNQLDEYAAQSKLSRPKAIAALLKQVQQQKETQPSDRHSQATQERARLLEELKAIREEIRESLASH